MLKLLTLGGLTVRSDSIQVEASRVRKPLALLAVVAAARETGVSRDRLQALFWPESDGDRARGALRQAQYLLRHGLGIDPFLAGAPSVALNPSVIASDLAEFQEQVKAAELEKAVAVYGGPFLDGVYLADLPDFEQWVDGERTRLAGLYGRALEQLAARATARHDNASAADWWRRRAELDRLDGRVAHHYMEALAADGSREAAIRYARLYAELVRSELGTEPDDRVSALAANLRAIATPAAAGARINEIGASLPLRNGGTPPSTGQPTAADHAELSTRVDADTPARFSRRTRILAATASGVLIILASASVYGVPRRGADNPAPAGSHQGVMLELRAVVFDDPRLAAVANRVYTATDSVLASFPEIDIRRNASLPQPRSADDTTPRYALTASVTGRAAHSDSILVRLRLDDLRRPGLHAELEPLWVTAARLSSSLPVLEERLAAAATALVDPWPYPIEGPVLGHTLPPTVQAYRELLEGARAFDRTEYPQAVSHFEAATRFGGYVTASALAATTFLDAGLCDSTVAIADRLRTQLLAVTDDGRLNLGAAFCRGDVASYEQAASKLARVIGGEYGVYLRTMTALADNNPRLADSLIRFGPLPPTRSNFNVHAVTYHALQDYRREIEMLDAVTRVPGLRNESWRLLARAEASAASGQRSEVDRTLTQFESLREDDLDEASFMKRVADEYDVHGDAAAARQMRLRALAWARTVPVSLTPPRVRLKLAEIFLNLDSLAEAANTANALLRDTLASPTHVEAAHGILGVVAARSGRPDRAAIQDRWLVERERHLEFGHSTMWRARIANALGRHGDALFLARRAIAAGYDRFFFGGGTKDRTPVHQIKEFSALASEDMH